MNRLNICEDKNGASIAPPENPSNANHVLQTTGETCGSQKRYLLWRWCLEPSGVDAVQGVRLYWVLVASIAGGLLDDRWVLADGFGGAGDGGLYRWTHVVIEGFVQLLVGVGSALCVRVLVVRGVAAVGAVHGIFTTRRRQVREAVIVDVQVVIAHTISLTEEQKRRIRREVRK